MPGFAISKALLCFINFDKLRNGSFTNWAFLEVFSAFGTGDVMPAGDDQTVPFIAVADEAVLLSSALNFTVFKPHICKIAYFLAQVVLS